MEPTSERVYTIQRVLSGWVVLGPDDRMPVSWASSEQEARRICAQRNAELAAKPPVTEVY